MDLTLRPINPDTDSFGLRTLFTRIMGVSKSLTRGTGEKTDYEQQRQQLLLQQKRLQHQQLQQQRLQQQEHRQQQPRLRVAQTLDDLTVIHRSVAEIDSYVGPERSFSSLGCSPESLLPSSSSFSSVAEREANINNTGSSIDSSRSSSSSSNGSSSSVNDSGMNCTNKDGCDSIKVATELGLRQIFPVYLPDYIPQQPLFQHQQHSRREQQRLHQLPPQRVTHILDLDGFLLENGFVCKELALIEVSTNRLMSEHFRLGRDYDQLTSREQQNVAFVTKNIHRIPFVDTPDDHLDQSDVAITLYRFLSSGYYSLADVVVGYKGGSLEQRLLHFLRIASVNLELLGCPKFNDLTTQDTYRQLMLDTVPDLTQIKCPLHIASIPRNNDVDDVTDQHYSPFHCAKHEVCVFRRWYLRCYLAL